MAMSRCLSSAIPTMAALLLCACESMNTLEDTSGPDFREAINDCSFPDDISNDYAKTTEDVYKHISRLKIKRVYIFGKTTHQIPNITKFEQIDTAFSRLEAYMTSCITGIDPSTNIFESSAIPALAEAIESINPNDPPDDIADALLKLIGTEANAILIRRFVRTSSRSGDLQYLIFISTEAESNQPSGYVSTTPFSAKGKYVIWRNDNLRATRAGGAIPVYRTTMQEEVAATIPDGREFSYTEVLDLEGNQVSGWYRVDDKVVRGFAILRWAD